MRKLSDDARALFDAATEIARTHRHAEVDRVHLLAAATADTRHQVPFARRGLDVVALASVVRERLLALDEVGAYRDGTRPADSAWFRDFVARARERRGLLDLFGVATARNVVDVLAEEPEVKALALAAPICAVDNEVAILLARTLAGCRFHPLVTPRHFALILAHDPDVVAACSATAAAELAEFRTRLDHDLAPLEINFARIDLDPDVRRVLFAVRPSPASYARRLFLAFLGEDEVGDLFEVPAPDAPITHAIVRAIAVGAPTGARAENLVQESAIANDALVEVVFFDDHFTTQELVVEILRDCFDHSDADALAAMMAVHEGGSHVVATLSAHEARHRVGIARARAAAAGAPLRIGFSIVDDV